MAAPASDEQHVLAEHGALGFRPVSHVRSTLISSSLQCLQELGHGPRYLGELDGRFRQLLTQPMAPSWLTPDVALAHYLACEHMALDSDELEALNTAVTKRLVNTLIATFIRSTRTLGGSPLLALRQGNLVWPRLFQGGSLRVVQLGPKDAQVEARGSPLLDVPYFARGCTVMVRAAALFFTRTAYARRLPTLEAELYRAHLSWV